MNRHMRRNPFLYPIVGVLSTMALLAVFAFGSAAAYDNVVMMRKTSDGNLTATANLPANPGLLVDTTGVGGSGAGAFIRVSVPQATGTSPTLDIIIQDSPDGTTWSNRVTFAQITAAGTYRQSIATNKKYIRASYIVTGTSPNFGAVQIGVDTGSEYKG